MSLCCAEFGDLPASPAQPTSDALATKAETRDKILLVFIFDPSLNDFSSRSIISYSLVSQISKMKKNEKM